MKGDFPSQNMDHSVCLHCEIYVAYSVYSNLLTGLRSTFLNCRTVLHIVGKEPEQRKLRSMQLYSLLLPDRNQFSSFYEPFLNKLVAQLSAVGDNNNYLSTESYSGTFWVTLTSIWVHYKFKCVALKSIRNKI